MTWIILILGFVISAFLFDTAINYKSSDKCSDCDGDGGYVHPDGLSAHECEYCKGTGKKSV